MKEFTEKSLTPRRKQLKNSQTSKLLQPITLSAMQKASNFKRDYKAFKDPSARAKSNLNSNVKRYFEGNKQSGARKIIQGRMVNYDKLMQQGLQDK